jgi:4-hydroxy-tetrahydrodipicolinate reductase
MSLKVAICGAMGKMGLATVKAVSEAPDLELAALIDPKGGEYEGLPVWKDLTEALVQVKPEVCVDFTHPDAAVPNALACLAQGVSPVIGTSGVDKDGLAQIRKASAMTPALVVPNFAIGAILMMRFAEIAAQWMTEAAIVELHRFEKEDAPSGTAMHTATRIAAARIPPPPAEQEEGGRGVEVSPSPRSQSSPTSPAGGEVKPGIERLIKAESAMGASVEGIPVHSIRLPGLLAHQEVLFGAPGETLTIRHDSLDRISFMPGVLVAVRKVRSLRGLTVGLEALMFE